MRAKPRIMWAITDLGGIYFWHVMPQRNQAIKQFVGNNLDGRDWRYWRRRGLRVVKVKVCAV